MDSPQLANQQQDTVTRVTDFDVTSTTLQGDNAVTRLSATVETTDTREGNPAPTAADTLIAVSISGPGASIDALENLQDASVPDNLNVSKLSPEELEKLLDKIDQSESEAAAEESSIAPKKPSNRVNFRVGGIVVRGKAGQSVMVPNIHLFDGVTLDMTNVPLTIGQIREGGLVKARSSTEVTRVIFSMGTAGKFEQVVEAAATNIVLTGINRSKAGTGFVT